MGNYRGFSETIEKLPEELQGDFRKWWRNLPRFNFHFDMESIVVLAYEAGYNRRKQEENNDSEV